MLVLNFKEQGPRGLKVVWNGPKRRKISPQIKVTFYMNHKTRDRALLMIILGILIYSAVDLIRGKGFIPEQTGDI